MWLISCCKFNKILCVRWKLQAILLPHFFFKFYVIRKVVHLMQKLSHVKNIAFILRCFVCRLFFHHISADFLNCVILIAKSFFIFRRFIILIFSYAMQSGYSSYRRFFLQELSIVLAALHKECLTQLNYAGPQSWSSSSLNRQQ